MAVSKRAWLPLFCSFLTGIGVLCAVGYMSQRIPAGISRITLWAALIVFVLWAWGYYRTFCFLAQYGREAAALIEPQTREALKQLASQVNAGQAGDLPDFSSAPLLRRSVKETLRAVRRGAFPSADRLAESDERALSSPERALRTYMDIALNIGIAGTFVSILVTLGQPQGLTADTLLAHVGPGMTSGLAAVVANVGLRLCHRALQDEQDALAEQVDDTLADALLANIHRIAISPEERLAQATAKALTDQSGRFDTLLRQYAGQIGSILTQQIQQPIQQIADHARLLAVHSGALAQHSGTWAETASDLKAAHSAFLTAQSDAQGQHELRLTTAFAQYRHGLDAFLQTAKQSNTEAMQGTQAFTHRLLEEHTLALTGMIEHLQAQFVALQAEQEAAHLRITARTLTAFTSAVDARLTEMDGRVAAVLSSVEQRLPETLREGVHGGLSETVALIDAVREQTAGIAHQVAQISGNADRQLLAYERWHDRAMSVQGRLEQVVNDGQSAQAALLAGWQAEAATTLDGVRAAFDATAHEAQSGFTRLADGLGPLTEVLQRLQSTTEELQSILSVLPAQVTETRVTLSETAPTLRDIGSACHDIHTILDTLSASTTLLLDRARNVQEDAQRQSQEASHDLNLLTQAVGSAVTQMDRAVSAFAVVASHAPLPGNGHAPAPYVPSSPPAGVSENPGE